MHFDIVDRLDFYETSITRPFEIPSLLGSVFEV